MERPCTAVTLAAAFVASPTARQLLMALPLTALATYSGTLFLCWRTFVSEGPHGGVQDMMFGLLEANFTAEWRASFIWPWLLSLAIAGLARCSSLTPRCADIACLTGRPPCLQPSAPKIYATSRNTVRAPHRIAHLAHAALNTHSRR
jgi:hypothetical protein